MKTNIKNVSKPASVILFCLLSCWIFPANAADLSCDITKVELDGQVIVVQPNGTDDTENIQCALNEAKTNGYKTVRLINGNYNISSIQISTFYGTLEGKSKATTTLNILDTSIDCAAMESAGKTTAAIKFDQGEPRIRFMTIQSGNPCTSSSVLSALIHFSGSPVDGMDCSNDVIFGNADRLIMQGIGVQVRHGILAAGESYILGGCKNALLGTVKINQSEIRGFRYGVSTSMKSGAQVDINFTSFDQNRNNIWIQDSFQSTTITNNTFSGGSNSIVGSHIGINVRTNNASPPNTTAVTIKNNTFNITSEDGIKSWGIASTQLQKIVDINLIITNNTFNMTGRVAGVGVNNVSNGVIIGNSFSGTASTAIEINANSSNPALNWVMMGNSGFAGLTVSDSHIHLGPFAENAVIGAGQGGSIVDWGTNNTVIP